MIWGPRAAVVPLLVSLGCLSQPQPQNHGRRTTSDGLPDHPPLASAERLAQRLVRALGPLRKPTACVAPTLILPIPSLTR